MNALHRESFRRYRGTGKGRLGRVHARTRSVMSKLPVAAGTRSARRVPGHYNFRLAAGSRANFWRGCGSACLAGSSRMMLTADTIGEVAFSSAFPLRKCSSTRARVKVVGAPGRRFRPGGGPESAEYRGRAGPVSHVSARRRVIQDGRKLRSGCHRPTCGDRTMATSSPPSSTAAASRLPPGASPGTLWPACNRARCAASTTMRGR